MRWMLWSALSPSQCLALLIVAGAALLAAGRGRLGRRLCLLGGGALFLFGLLPLAHYLVGPLEQRFPRPVLPAEVAGILLLAGSELPALTERFGEPQFSRHGARYTTTLRLAARYPRARIVFVGGPPRDAPSGELGQSGVARQLLTQVGLDPVRLTFDERSTDTCDSASNAKAAVRPQPGERWVVVTSALHLPRTVACFRAAGWEVIPHPADYLVAMGTWAPGLFQVANNLTLLDLGLHEWLGLAYYRVTGRTGVFLPGP
jgi:uncharacterized SAM-binding protein YcdF (DUF218 family)